MQNGTLYSHDKGTAVEAARQLPWIVVIAEDLQEPGLALQDIVRSVEAFRRQACGENAAFCRAAEMQALHH